MKQNQRHTTSPGYLEAGTCLAQLLMWLDMHWETRHYENKVLKLDCCKKREYFCCQTFHTLSVFLLWVYYRCAGTRCSSDGKQTYDCGSVIDEETDNGTVLAKRVPASGEGYFALWLRCVAGLTQAPQSANSMAWINFKSEQLRRLQQRQKMMVDRTLSWSPADLDDAVGDPSSMSLVYAKMGRLTGIWWGQCCVWFFKNRDLGAQDALLCVTVCDVLDMILFWRYFEYVICLVACVCSRVPGPH